MSLGHDHAKEKSRRQATRIQLDAQGQPTNPINPWGNPWATDAINYAKNARSFAVYSEMMDVLRKCWHTSLIRGLIEKPESEAKKRSKERERALPISRPRRRGKSKMWK